MSAAATLPNPSVPAPDQAVLNAARAAMLHSQLQPSGVIDERLLKAIADTPREDFVDAGWRALAYAEAELPLGRGRAMMAPLPFGHLMQKLLPEAKDRMLVVGCGSGWSAAVCAKLAGFTVALEEDERLAERAGALLADMPGVTLARGPLAAGWPDGAPYDLILVDGAVARLPQAFADQLAEGGRLAAIIAGDDGVERACVAVKAAGRLTPEPFIEAGAPMLPGFQPAPAFTF